MPSLRLFRALALSVALAFPALYLAGCRDKKAPQPVYTSNPAPLPEPFAKALDGYRPEGSRGWSFVQETTTRSTKMVERHDASEPEFKSWTLLEKNGHPPTEEETKDYTERLSRQPRSDNAPNVRDQVLADSWTLLPATAEGLERYQFRLKPGAEDDLSAAHMAVIFEFDPKSQTILAVELKALNPFSPTFGVSIDEAQTRVSYSAPKEDAPVLIQDIRVKVRGKAFWFKSLDQDMSVVYRDYSKPVATTK